MGTYLMIAELIALAPTSTLTSSPTTGAQNNLLGCRPVQVSSNLGATLSSGFLVDGTIGNPNIQNGYWHSAIVSSSAPAQWAEVTLASPTRISTVTVWAPQHNTVHTQINGAVVLVRTRSGSYSQCGAVLSTTGIGNNITRSCGDLVSTAVRVQTTVMGTYLMIAELIALAPASTVAPTAKPTSALTARPTSAPTAKPTSAPTANPTSAPTAKPTSAPTAMPTSEPPTAATGSPTAAPNRAPTVAAAQASSGGNPDGVGTIGIVVASVTVLILVAAIGFALGKRRGSLDTSGEEAERRQHTTEVFVNPAYEAPPSGDDSHGYVSVAGDPTYADVTPDYAPAPPH